MPDTVSNSGPPPWAQPYFEGYLGRAQQTADQPYQGYGGQRVAGANPYMMQGWQAQAQRGMQGSPVMGAANEQLTNTINGGMMGGNPYLTGQIDQAQGDLARNWNNVAKPSWDTGMQRSGSYGNAGVALAHENAQNDMQKNMAGIGQNMRFNNYTNERNNQMQAMGMAPQFAQQDYNDINAVTQAGTAMQGQEQRQLDNQYNQFLEARNYPREQLDIMGNALGRVSGNQQTTSTPGPGMGQQVVGGGLTGLALYNMLFGKGP